MKFIIIMFLFSVLTSCLKVSFNQPQPKDGIRLTEFPEEVRGTWTSEKGNFFTIGNSGIGYSTLMYDSLENIMDTAYRYVGLSDSIRLYRGGKYYVYNEQDDNGSWTFVVSKVDRKGNIFNYICDDFKRYSKLDDLTADSAMYRVPLFIPELDEVIEIDTTVYNPTMKELRKIDDKSIHWVYFNGQIQIKDLRKITIRKNLFEIYWADGRHEGKLKPPKQGDNEPEE